MAIGVDTSKWKPRKLKGTPALKVANILGTGILILGTTIGIFLHYGNFTANMRKNFEKLYEDPVEEIQRRQLIAAGLPVRSEDQVKRLMKNATKIE